MKHREPGTTRVFRVKISKRTSDKLDELINEKIYVTYADAIRHGIERLLNEHGR
jgi:Arc/MetJ-type ribon-helix-helix transcriptional regulator